MMLRERLAKLEARSLVSDVRRIFFLIPDLWPEDDRAAFETVDGEDLADLVERRTGLRPKFSAGHIWAITVPVPDELLAHSDAEKGAFLEEQETRPRAPWQRKEWP